MALQAQGQSSSDIARQLDDEALLSREQAQREAGGAAGIVIATGGAATPILIDPSAWQTWLIFGCITIFVACIALLLIRRAQARLSRARVMEAAALERSSPT